MQDGHEKKKALKLYLKVIYLGLVYLQCNNVHKRFGKRLLEYHHSHVLIIYTIRFAGSSFLIYVVPFYEFVCHHKILHVMLERFRHSDVLA